LHALKLADRLADMEKKYDKRFRIVFDILKQLMELHFLFAHI